MESFNYFNYFTEIEEYFFRKRGAHLLVSPLDWAIVETWQKAGIPLDAVLKGIDRAFESWQRSRRAAGGRQLKSLAYCVDAVLDAAAEAREAAAGTGPEVKTARPAVEPFSRDELKKYFERNASRLRAAAEKQRMSHATLAVRLRDAAQRLEEASALLDSSGLLDLEDLERRLTVLEEKLTATLLAEADDESMLAVKRELDRSLAPYRRRMSAEQMGQLERQYTQKRLFEQFEVPRLSLFYLT
jgi:ribosome-binding protein aMBF1 (putative translation factor)